jgi:hypothetical protein
MLTLRPRRSASGARNGAASPSSERPVSTSEKVSTSTPSPRAKAVKKGYTMR